MNKLLKDEIEPPLEKDLTPTELVIETTTTSAQLFKGSEIIHSDFNIINSSSTAFRAKSINFPLKNIQPPRDIVISCGAEEFKELTYNFFGSI